MIALNDLLVSERIEPKTVLVLRHRPQEPQLRRTLGGLAAEQPVLFNAYQQTQSERVEKQMQRAKHVASFIGHEPSKALFVGLYQVGTSKILTREQYWQVPENIELRDKFGMRGFVEEKDDRSSILWFDLGLMDTYACWKGKLIISWPPPEISWSRWAAGNEMPVAAILEESVLEKPMPRWDEICLAWGELSLLSATWKSKLAEWRAIYYIFDISDGKGYVGSAYGDTNLNRRWETYATTGHGGNRLLCERDPKNFRFSILQRVSPDMDTEDVISLENTWKKRLHTRDPLGLNDN
ncbi:MAG TPA: GIY-YIG nuclease family protein [Terriglobales bacterium]|nr:GIY-YIG nuclease family protein [Terriglobales bacterium]